MCTDRTTSCGNTLRRHIGRTNRFTLAVYWRISVKISVSATEFLSPQQVAKILSDLIFFCHMLLRQNSFAKTKIFSKILQYTRSDLSLRRVAETCFCDLSPKVYRPLDMRTRRQFRQCRFLYKAEKVPSQNKRHNSSNSRRRVFHPRGLISRLISAACNQAYTRAITRRAHWVKGLL